MHIYKSYQEHITVTEAEIKKITAQINSNSLARLAVIILGGAALFKSFQSQSIALVAIIFFVILFIFIFLVRRQSRLERIRQQKQAFLQVNMNELALVEGLPNIYMNGSQFEDAKHPYISDLDVFGAYSIFNQINRAATVLGVEQLASWFLSPSPVAEIEARQEAAKELAEDLSWAQKFQAALIFNLGQKLPVKAFLSNYFKDASFSFGNAFMRLFIWVGPFLIIAGLFYSIFIQNIIGYVIILGFIHLFWTLALSGKVSVFSSKIDKIGQIIDSYAEAIALLEQKSFRASQTINLQQRLAIAEEGKLLSKAFKDLADLINKLDARNNMFVGTILNILFLWDFRQVLAIAKWKKNYEENILEALDVIAEFEALLSLATYRRNHATWVEPTFIADAKNGKIQAENLGHPLILSEQMVVNSYEATDHSIALITGSNMAGKSTFLRTIGINAVLAYAGAVVCATKLELPIYQLVTYMRIKDDLKESTSTFKAELDRMRFILTTVAAQKDTYFLIDEMLRGTNSVDKYLGSRAIIKKLIAEQGKGMVATHDLQLSSLSEEYPQDVKNFHFDIQVKDGEMKFDYALKNGECQVFNASLLLKGIGIDVENN